MKVTVGCDPEFQLVHKGCFVSAHDLIPGTKTNPHKLKNGAVQADGTAVEFNIEPAKTSQQFCANIKSVLSQIRKIIPEDYAFSFEPAVRFEEKYFENLPKKVKILGCDPDYAVVPMFESSTTFKIKETPKRDGTLCAYGGHIHVGWYTKDKPANTSNRSHIYDCAQVSRTFGNLTEPFFELFEKENDRQELYGSQFAFRPKSYGVEIRHPSCAWLSNEKLWPWIFDMAQFTVKYLAENLEENRTCAYLPSVFYRSNHKEQALMKIKRFKKMYKDFPDSFPLDDYK